MKNIFGVRRHLIFLVVSLMMVVSVSVFSAETISGRVVGVADGDTITVLVSGRDQVKIRLAIIDAPEKAQAFGQRSKQAMSDLAFGKAVECNQSGLDRYGRTIAFCMVGGVDINLAMVKAGMAWVYRKYAYNVPDYYSAEDEAHRQRLGLWADQEPPPPWAWRHINRVKK